MVNFNIAIVFQDPLSSFDFDRKRSGLMWFKLGSESLEHLGLWHDGPTLPHKPRSAATAGHDAALSGHGDASVRQSQLPKIYA